MNKTLVNIEGCILALASPSALAQQTYAITDLGTLSGPKTVGTTFDNSGKFPGHSQIKNDLAARAARRTR